MPCTIQVCTNSRRPAFCWKWTHLSVIILLLLLLLYTTTTTSLRTSLPYATLKSLLRRSSRQRFPLASRFQRCTCSPKHVRVRPSAGLSVSGTDVIRLHRPIIESADRPVPKALFNDPQTVDDGGASFSAGHYRYNLSRYLIAISFSLSFYLIKCFPLVIDLSVSRYVCSKISDNR